VTRAQALTFITADVAEHGEIGQAAIRAYVEHRISRAAFNEACRRGMAHYQHRQLAVKLAAENDAIRATLEASQ
jgi:hypothetical protein